MATLTQDERDKIWRGVMREFSQTNDPTNFGKSELATQVGNIDDWIDANGTAINQAYDEPFRTNASSYQKLLIFTAVAAMRTGNEELARKLIGELD